MAKPGREVVSASSPGHSTAPTRSAVASFRNCPIADRVGPLPTLRARSAHRSSAGRWGPWILGRPRDRPLHVRPRLGTRPGARGRVAGTTTTRRVEVGLRRGRGGSPRQGPSDEEPRTSRAAEASIPWLLPLPALPGQARSDWLPLTGSVVWTATSSAARARARSIDHIRPRPHAERTERRRQCV